jgi:AmmeMemoRadiSam system protein B
MERSPAVAGLFYPDEPDSLRRDLNRCLEGSRPQTSTPVALLAPHAGYLYSGRTAGRVYGSVEVPDHVLLLGPNHTGLGRPAAVWSQGSWRTPLGQVAVDEEVAADLVGAHPALEADVAAHRREHALEVQLPFLQSRNPRVTIVPVCLADRGLDLLLEMGAAMAGVLEVRPPGSWLIVISSDMTHFQPRDAARRQDELAIRRLEEVDAAGLYRTVRDHGISMCGVVPAVVGLAAAARLGATRGQLVDYSCSGDVTGDDSDVVAYAGLTIT